MIFGIQKVCLDLKNRKITFIRLFFMCVLIHKKFDKIEKKQIVKRKTLKISKI